MTRGDAVYRFAQLIPRLVWGPLAGLRVEGLENVPPTGPFLLICNHQSNLDPILIQAVCPRALHSMAKSTQFAAPVVGRIMKRLLAFPVRRYQADPHAVRYALRQLGRGEAVAIYIEGERTWDGQLQPPRLGTVRLALKAGVPIVPCTIAGSYDAWPRWDRRIRLRPVTIRFGPALHFPKLDDRTERERALPDAAVRIMAALAGQLAHPPASPDASF